MDIMTTKEAAESWGISQRRVAILCDEGRIPGAMKAGHTWLLPKGTAKPTDARLKCECKTKQTEEK